MAETMVVSRPPAQIVATGSAATNGAQRLSTPERLITAYFTAIPLLWLLGLLLPSALLLVFGILVVYVRSRRAVLIAIPWALVALSQVISVLTNMVAQSQPAIMFLKHLLSSYVLGWIVLAAAICIGASGMIRPQVFLHAVARIGFAYVILAIPAYIIAFTSSAPFLFFLSPAGYLVPATMNARNFSFGIFVYKWEDFLGTFMPRLGLFFPWSTAGGYAGLFLVLILLNEPNARRRRLGVSAGVFMVFASMSRLAIVALAACVTLRCFFALSRRMQVVLAVLIVSLMVALAAVVESPTALISQLNAEFEAARPGSNEARDLIYAMTWDAIREAPLLGHGWPGESTMAPDNSIFGEDAPFMVIGSHSTISGLIYKGGAITFGLFVFAFATAATLIVFAPYNTEPARNAAALLCAIALTCAGDGLESLVVPVVFAFIWLGMIMRDSWEGSWALGRGGDARALSRRGHNVRANRAGSIEF